MLLCDIGNTSYHFLDSNSSYKKDTKNFNPQTIKERVYYICVNPLVELVLQELPNWIDISLQVDKSNYYDTMGIDRIMACQSIQNGVIVDAGSAITVDVVKDGVYKGGFIYAGVNTMSKSYKDISSALSYEFNFDIDFSKLPKNSKDSITYGFLKGFRDEVNSFNMNIYIIGGDAKKFAKIFPDAILDKELIFLAMQKYLPKP